MARRRGESKNRFITKVLEQALRVRRDAEVTRRLNDLFADTDLTLEQARAAAELDSAGTDWNTERW